MSSITRDIEDAIRKNLTEEVASSLQKFIQEAKKDKEILASMNVQNESLLKNIVDLSSQNKILDGKIKDQDTLEAKEKLLKATEIYYECEKLKYQLEAEKDKNKTIFDLVSLVFRKEKYITTETGTKPVPYSYSNNGSSNSGVSAHTYSKTSEISKD